MESKNENEFYIKSVFHQLYFPKMDSYTRNHLSAQSFFRYDPIGKVTIGLWESDTKQLVIIQSSSFIKALSEFSISQGKEFIPQELEEKDVNPSIHLIRNLLQRTGDFYLSSFLEKDDITIAVSVTFTTSDGSRMGYYVGLGETFEQGFMSIRENPWCGNSLIRNKFKNYVI